VIFLATIEKKFEESLNI